MKRPPLVEVTWVDAKTNGEDIKLSQVAEKCVLVTRITAGYLVHNDQEKVVVAQSYDGPLGEEEAEVADTITLPTGWVKRIRYVTRSPKASRRRSATTPAAPPAAAPA